MSHRPYPNRDRALRQIARHPLPAVPVPQWRLDLAAQANAALAAVAEVARSFQPGAWHPDAIFDPKFGKLIPWPTA